MKNNGKERIALIIPPSPFLANERVFVSLGILKVAACLEQAGYPVDVLDLSGVENYGDVVANYVADNSYVDYFGITVTTPQCPSGEAISNRIREAANGRRTRIIWGGPHVTVVNAARKLEVKKGIVGRAHKAFARIASVADVLVAGDGEEAIFAAIQPYAPKLIDADDQSSSLFIRPHKEGDFLFPVELNIAAKKAGWRMQDASLRLEEMPFPARHLIDLNSYHYYIDGQRAASLIMQLGCPFSCRFCSGRLSPSFRLTRIRSIDSVLEEIKQIYQDYGYRGLMMYDDEINVNPNMIQDMYAIAALQNKLGIDFRLRGFIKANLFNDEQAIAMKEAGFKEMCVGFESGAPRILKNIKKQATVEQNTRCLEIAKRYGLRVKSFTSIGHPGESEETIQQTHDWLISSEVDDFDTTIISTFPGTPYYDDAVPLTDKMDVWVYTTPETKDRLYAQEIDYVSVAEYYKGQIDDGYRAYVHTDFLSSGELVKLRDWVERDVRNKLGLPFYQTAPTKCYDASMGQLPGYIYRRSDDG
jgi:radical SAM superfamily enzyme YgiQ (UPF0313 family)